MPSKLYYQALKKLPDRFVDDDTHVREFFGGTGIVAVNPNHAPIVFYTDEWELINFTE